MQGNVWNGCREGGDEGVKITLTLALSQRERGLIRGHLNKECQHNAKQKQHKNAHK